MVDILVDELKLSKDEVLVAYDKFIKKHPTGEICKDDFQRENQGNIMAETLFDVLDKNQRGALNFYEFMMVKNTSSLKTPEKKLNWIFTAFDRDGVGSIDVKELRDIVVGLFIMSDNIEYEKEVKYCVKELRKAIAVDGDGTISKDEFVNIAMKSSFICNMVSDRFA